MQGVLGTHHHYVTGDVAGDSQAGLSVEDDDPLDDLLDGENPLLTPFKGDWVKPTRPVKPQDSVSSPYLQDPDDARSRCNPGASARLAWNKAEASKSRPEVARQHQDVFVNIMVAGESGQGKTTCIENLFAAYHPDVSFELHDGSTTSVEAFRECPQQLCAHLPPVELDDPPLRLHYSIQDTPGYGNEMDVQATLSMLVNHVRASKQAQAVALEHLPKNIQLPGVELKHMLDLCLYFIPAHRLKVVDLYFMAALSKELALIPVIAKSDCMTPEELTDFKSHVLARLMDPQVEGIEGPIEIYNFPGKVLEEAGVDRPVPPFAVVGSKDMGPPGSFWPLRRYKWGDCECANYEHSDFQLLKELVFERGFDALRQDKWRRYLRFASGQEPPNPLPRPSPSQSWSSRVPALAAVYRTVLQASRHIPHSMLALVLLAMQAVALGGMLLLMVRHTSSSIGVTDLLRERVSMLPRALNTSMLEHSADFERLYSALVQNRTWDWGKMALMLIWCLPAAFALGMYRAHLTSRGRETGLQTFRVQDLLMRLQCPAADKGTQATVMPAAALSLGCILGDDVYQDRRTLSASVNALHDMLGHLSPVCQQAAAMALGSMARNATPQWRYKLACSSVIDALVPLLQPGHIPRQQAALYCLRILAVVPSFQPKPAEQQDLFGQSASSAPQPAYSVVEPALKVMAEAGALPLMVDLAIASGQIATQEAVVAALKLFASMHMREGLRHAFLRRMATVPELPRLLEVVGELGSRTGRRRAEELEQALADLPAIDFY